MITRAQYERYIDYACKHRSLGNAHFDIGLYKITAYRWFLNDAGKESYKSCRLQWDHYEKRPECFGYVGPASGWEAIWKFAEFVGYKYSDDLDLELLL